MDSVDKFIIDFDIWFKKHVLRYGDRKNLVATLKGLGGSDERDKHIRARFPSQPVS